jgi:O-glycosyl hydrolase
MLHDGKGFLKMRRLFPVVAAAVLISLAGRVWQLRSAQMAGVEIAVDAAIRQQRFDGFGQATTNPLVHPGVKTLSDSLRMEAVQKAYKEIGISTGGIGALLESPGGWDRRQNDNSDPFNVNWKGFDAAPLISTKRFVIDLARPLGYTNYFLGGETPNVRWASPWLANIRREDYNRFLDEAAEQVLATVTYWKTNYGEELPYYQLGNEQLSGNHASRDPDKDSYGGVDPKQQLVDLVKRVGARLREAGFQKTRFIVANEETEEISFAVASAMLADEQARSYIGVIGYHTYPYNTGYSSTRFILATYGTGRPDAERVAIRNRIRDLANRYNVKAWLTETSHGGNPKSYENFRARTIHIHDEFLYANASAYFCMSSMWDEASHKLHFGNTNTFYDDDGSAVLINNSTRKVDITGMGYAIGHYARWVKPGAIRVESKTSNPLVQVTAFRDDNTGRLVLIVINNANEPLTVTVNVKGGKLEGTLTGEQSTLAGYWAALGNLTADNPGSWHLAVPDNSVTTIAAKMAR